LTSRRDPEGRRRALVTAAREVIAEVGVGRTTHRAVAARAAVPLGATTYYFPTLADLVTGGLDLAAADLREQLHAWQTAIDTGTDLPAVLTRLVTEYLADRDRALLEYEVYLAAARDPALRPLARTWLDTVHAMLTPRTGAGPARAIAALLDGAMVQSLVTGDPLDPGLETAVTALLRPATPQ
jgi:DNA-binding transcriptional regulator YbjK